MTPPPPLLLAISGPSCSGKTTLSRLLRDTLSPHALILHEDDFYLTDAEIPLITTPDGRQLQDWDCLESLDLVGMEDMLRHVKSTGRIKDGFGSKEDQNSVGSVDVDAERVQRARGEVRQVVGVRRVVLVDGFLLFAEGMKEIRDLFDVRLLLTVDYETIKRRREARKGYVTLEGFWEDPPGYVDSVVWPNYVRDHEFLYRNGKIGEGVDEQVCEGLGIKCLPVEARESMTDAFEWAVGVMVKELKGRIDHNT